MNDHKDIFNSDHFELTWSVVETGGGVVGLPQGGQEAGHLAGAEAGEDRLSPLTGGQEGGGLTHQHPAYGLQEDLVGSEASDELPQRHPHRHGVLPPLLGPPGVEGLQQEEVGPVLLLGLTGQSGQLLHLAVHQEDLVAELPDPVGLHHGAVPPGRHPHTPDISGEVLTAAHEAGHQLVGGVERHLAGSHQAGHHQVPLLAGEPAGARRDEVAETAAAQAGDGLAVDEAALHQDDDQLLQHQLGPRLPPGPEYPVHHHLQERYSQALIGQEILHYCALIGRELHTEQMKYFYSDAAPALLCDKDTAQGTQSPLLVAYLAFRCVFMP